MNPFQRTLCAMAAVLLAACGESTPPVARVNGEAITRAAYEAQVGLVMQRYRGQGQPPGSGVEQRVKESVLRRMVDDLIIAQEARRLGVALTAQEIEQHFQDNKRRFGTEEAFQDYIKRTYGTEQALRDDAASNLLREQVIEKAIGPIEVTDDEIGKYYEENKARFVERERVRASRILVPVGAKASGAEKTSARDRARALRAKAAAAGADFAALAKAASAAPEAAKGGELGWLVRGRVPAALEVVFKLPAGAVSGVVETPAGYEIVKVWEKRAERALELEAVKESISGTLQARKKNDRRREALQRLQDGARVEQLFLL